MKAYLEKLIAGSPVLVAQHLVREYLQARVLQSLQRAGAMQTLAFHGGTALRFLYNIPRYSEDLDFALENARQTYNFRNYLQQIAHDFTAEAYTLDCKLNEQQVVHKAFIRFRGLLHELGLSAHSSEVLAIKLEVDTNPPAGAQLTTTILQRHVPLNLQHHDRASLLAGKLHAVLQRAYPKGRDIFDLWWYLTQPDWPPPNLNQLTHALAQSGWAGPQLHAGNWRDAVRQRIERLAWQKESVPDLQAFIIGSEWEKDLHKEALLKLLAD